MQLSSRAPEGNVSFVLTETAVIGISISIESSRFERPRPHGRTRRCRRRAAQRRRRRQRRGQRRRRRRRRRWETAERRFRLAALGFRRAQLLQRFVFQVSFHFVTSLQFNQITQLIHSVQVYSSFFISIHFQFIFDSFSFSY